MRLQRPLSAITKGSVAAMFVLSLSLAACGGTGSSSGGVIKIATDLPVSGTDASVGLPTQYGADLAISQNQDLGGGYTLQVVHKNDEGTTGADPTIGAANIRALLADPQVMAVVGPFNSGVAVAEIPVANTGGLVLISPANTNPGLTKEQYAAARGINFAQLHPAGSKEYYFRVPATDDVQGKVDAQIAAGDPINAKTAFVVDDSTTYGAGLADFFKTNFTSGGGTVAGSHSITPQEVSSLNSLAATIIAAKPDVVFYGGVTSQGGGALKRALVAGGYTGPLVGGDGIADDPSWITTAGANASANTYGTVAAPDPASLTSGDAAKFKTDYAAFAQGKSDSDLLPYSAAAYACATIEIAAIKAVIKSGKAPTRAAVRDYIAGNTFPTIIGNISFDQNGDNAGDKVFSIYAINPGASTWVFSKEVTA
ncbi:MAG TPA: branched-chain amino acid ABC transporter substrate-binding protein [Ktedonobacterales bacterium]|nr:branched-chain amino acid ABC transporter substrate-binding protein [Ktedonobacterales bacterium]